MSGRRGPIATRIATTLALIALAVAALGLLGAPAAQARVALGVFLRDGEKNPAKIAGYGRRVGRDPVIVGSYKDWGGVAFDGHELKNVWSAGAVPMVTWEPWGHPLRKIARGSYDDYIRTTARAARTWGRPVFLRFAHEMNGNWYPWGQAAGPRLYKRAWRHVVRIFRRVGADNALWVWTPYASRGLPFASRYPGGRWVDWVGLDGLNWGGSFGWRSFAEIFGPSYGNLRRLSSAPMIIAEAGSGESGGSKASWVSRALRGTLPRMRHVRALLWWSVADPRGDIRVDSSGSATRAFRGAARNRYYGVGRRGLLRTPRRLRPLAKPRRPLAWRGW